MNPFGDGSGGALNVTSGTTNLPLNTKHQYTTVNVSSGATLSTASTTGAVLYIVATTSITIDGTIDLSNKINPGAGVYSVVIDGVTYNGRGVANGSDGGGSGGLTSNGFGGGGRGGQTSGATGGIGGAGSATFGTPGSSRDTTANGNVTSAVNGNAGTGSAGGGGAAYAEVTGSNVSGANSGNSGAGGGAYSANGADATPGYSFLISPPGGGSFATITGGGGGAGGRAGRQGPTLVLKAPTIVLNGTIITSGTNGGNGGNGGRSTFQSGPINFWGFGGGAGGGGNAGDILVSYATAITDTSTKTMTGGTGGTGGAGGTNFTNFAGSGSSGSAGTATIVQIAPYANFSATPISGQRPLNVTFTNLSLGADSYLWDFGDAATSTATNPSHSYTTPGTYTVTLTSTNEAGDDVETKTDYITVTLATYPREAKGTLVFSGGATRQYEATREAEGTLVFSGNVFAIKRSDPSAIEKKTYMYKVYDEDDNFVGVWDDVVSEPNWSQELNSTGSATTVTLARNSDSLATSTAQLLDSDSLPIQDNNDLDILTTVASRNKVGPGSDVSHNYRVDIFVFYGETSPILDSDGLEIEDNVGETIDGTIGAPNGIRKFSGFISEINTKYGSDENTEVQLMSYGFDLDQYPVVTVGGDTTVPFNSYDPSDIVREGLDQFAVDAAGESFTTYNIGSISDTSTTASYTFRVNTYRELLDTAVKLAPSGWTYWIGLGDNLVRFKSKPLTAQHTFFLGKHFKALNLRSYIGDVVNDVIFSGGGDPALFKRYVEAPLAGTRRGLSRPSDNRVELESSADLLAQGEIDEKSPVQYRSTIEILDKTYDIESIDVGHMIEFRNFDNYVDALMMQVVALNYTPDIVTLQLDTLPPSVPKRLEELRKALNTQETINVPDAPDI